MDYKKSTVIINGHPFEYEEEQLSLDTGKPISEEDALYVLKLTKQLLNTKGINFYLYWGTLLGAVREKGIIKGDEDVDVYIDEEEKFFSAIPYFYENGLKIIRIRPHYYYSFRAPNGYYIDFYVVCPLRYSPWAWTCKRINHYYQPKWIFEEHEEIDFLGEKFLCPKNPEKVLEVLYGPSWRVPMKGHHFPSEVKSAHIYHTIIAYVKRIIHYDQLKKMINNSK